MSEREEHDKLADDLEKDADESERRSEELQKEIGDAREDWQAKRRDPGVPGAEPPRGDDDET